MSESCAHRGPKTGRVTATMPVRHERRCEACGERFWSIPTEMGASYRVLSKAKGEA